ncbi:Ryanodine receptor 3 [Cichlidogyrus casuarinus]|uniref:Ryanodine receptor 3 n=1 Tax=Cichlidogyrus casuarinus TaxID=1844966 RepID=A0ABD2QMD9_9PLAT
MQNVRLISTFPIHNLYLAEACWWTIHPASKQRTVGEKVRIGDDLILVSVSSERYLHVHGDADGVIASFRQTLWTVIPFSNGVIRGKSMSNFFVIIHQIACSLDSVLGSDIIRLFHGDECLTVPEPEQDDQLMAGGSNNKYSNEAPGGPPLGQLGSKDNTDGEPLPLLGLRNTVMYEIGSVETQARSLWYIEHTKTKWSGRFFSWNCSIRLRNVTTGRYLGITLSEEDQSEWHSNDPIILCTLSPEDATEDACVFTIKSSKDDKKKGESEPEQEGMGDPDVQLSETLIYLHHQSTGRWLSYEAYETKKRGVGRVEEKKAVLLTEGHMDDVFTVVRSQVDEQKSTQAIRRTTFIFQRFNTGLDEVISANNQAQSQAFNPFASMGIPGLSGTQAINMSSLASSIPLDEMLQCLEDLTNFFQQPSPHEDLEKRQSHLNALKNRQNLFQLEGIISLVLYTIEKYTLAFAGRREFAQVVGEERVGDYEALSNQLYLFLAALIRGNRENCAQFAAPNRLDWLFNRLQSQQNVAEGVIDTLHCVLTDSDEALNLITPNHIRTLINLLDKQGRDAQVLQVLCALCLGRQGGAVRLNQNLIYDTLIPDQDLLLQTRLVDECCCIRPNIFVGIKDGGSMYSKWYFEVIIDSILDVTHEPAKVRVGWANTEGFDAFPGGGPGWGNVSLGDDLFSYAFDGRRLWTGGKSKLSHISNQLSTPQPDQTQAPASPGCKLLKRGDVIGCLLDLSGPVIQFNVNGSLVKGYFQDFNTSGLFFPCVTITAKASLRFLFGGNQGKLRFGPPQGYSPINEARLASQRLRLEPVFFSGTLEKCVVSGSAISPTPSQSVFVPQTILTAGVQLSSYVEAIRDKLAENIHEMWTMRKIEQGWQYCEKRDDARKLHPCLTNFSHLPSSERQYDITLAYETLRTIVGLGFNISFEPAQQENTRMKVLKVPQSFTQSNGYKPQPLDLSQVRLNQKLENLVSQLAENTHNMWARDRINQGWTYGLTEDTTNKRSPHLVPFLEVDEFIQQSNRETSLETVKTLLAYGFTIDPLPQEPSEQAKTVNVVMEKAPRSYRVQSTRGVTQGKWYYEIELLTSGFVRVGWTQVTAPAGTVIGSHVTSFAFCTNDVKFIAPINPFQGSQMEQDRISLWQNMPTRGSYVPAFSLGPGQQIKFNFGNDVQTLRYFTSVGLQEGYSPFCVNMVRTAPLWFAKEDPNLFIDIDSQHRSLEVICKTAGVQGESAILEYMRLSLGIKCKNEFTKKSMQERRQVIETKRRQLEPDHHPETNQFQPQFDPNALAMMNPDFMNSKADVRGKKMKLGNPFKKGKGRDTSPEALSAIGGSLLSGGAGGSGGGSTGPTTGSKFKGGNTAQMKLAGGAPSGPIQLPPGGIPAGTSPQEALFMIQQFQQQAQSGSGGGQNAMMMMNRHDPFDYNKVSYYEKSYPEISSSAYQNLATGSM